MSAFFAVLGVLTILLTPFLTFVLLICAATKKAYSTKVIMYLHIL